MHSWQKSRVERGVEKDDLISVLLYCNQAYGYVVRMEIFERHLLLQAEFKVKKYPSLLCNGAVFIVVFLKICRGGSAGNA